MANGRGRSLPLIGLMVIGVLLVLAGVGVYSERNAPNSQIPMAPGLPSNPDATIGIIIMGLGVAMVVSGLCVAVIGVGPSPS